MTDARLEVLEAAAALVDAFGQHDAAAYFAGFAADATFVFHTAEQPLRSRGEYEELWSVWERESGFRVLACSSADQHVQLLGDVADGVAVFTHRVHTLVRTADGEEAVDERETIVFGKGADGRWLAVHEHLSPVPGH